MNQDQTKRILTDLFTDDFVGDSADDLADDVVPCHANQDAIVAYVEAELEQRDVLALYPALHAQLNSCASCRLVYAELKALLMMEEAGTLVEPSREALFALPFLQPTAPTQALEQATAAETPDPIQWLVNELGQMIVALSADFLAALQPPMQPAHLKSSTRDLFAVTSPAITDDLSVTLAGKTMRRQPDYSTITVTAEIPSRGGWPHLGGTTVTLAIGEDLVETRETDAFGKVVFAGIALADLARLRITVEPM